jgi:hypothetical protein
LALDNLGRDFPPDLIASVLGGSGGSAVQLGDSLDGTRLLLLPERLQPGEALTALAPHADMLLCLPATMLDDPEKLAEGLRLLECDGHPPLLDRPVRVTREGFELIDAPGS